MTYINIKNLIILITLLASLIGCYKPTLEKLIVSCFKASNAKDNQLSQKLCKCQAEKILQSPIISKNKLRNLEEKWTLNLTYKNEDNFKIKQEILKIANTCFKEAGLNAFDEVK